MRNRRIAWSAALIILLAGGCACALFLTPWFNITEIEVHGSEKVPVESIVAASGIPYEENTFKVNLGHARDSLLTLPYIKTAEIKRESFGRKIVIEVTESRLVGYIRYVTSFVGIDEDGKAVKVAPEVPDGALVITGVQLEDPELGRKAAALSPDHLNTALTYIHELDKVSLLGEITYLDVTSTVNVKLAYQDRLSVICGDEDGLSRKLLVLKEVLASGEISPNSKGEIDLSINGEAHYTP